MDRKLKYLKCFQLLEMQLVINNSKTLENALFWQNN